MKIIHISGWSGSGKTTFILDLIRALQEQGKVGSIKHIGDHVCELPSGKDTTRHFQAGSSITSGIDQEKTMITCRSVSLQESLDLLADSGVRYAILEGFKDVPFRKVVIGDLDRPSLLKNPSVSEVIASLADFDDYYTLSALFREAGPCFGEEQIYIQTGLTSMDAGSVCLPLEHEIAGWDAICSVIVRYQPPVFRQKGQFFVLVRTDNPKTGFHALKRCLHALTGPVTVATGGQS